MKPDGSVKWRFPTYFAIWGSPALDKDDNILIGAIDGFIYSLTKDGSMRWRYRPSTNGFSSSVSIGKKGSIVIGCNDNYVYCMRGRYGFEENLSSVYIPREKPIQAYPNPFRDKLTVRTDDPCRVYDALGHRVASIDKGSNSLSTTSWTEGIYYIKSKNHSVRVMKQG